MRGRSGGRENREEREADVEGAEEGKHMTRKGKREECRKKINRRKEEM